jgi:hypothetical protein
MTPILLQAFGSNADLPVYHPDCCVATVRGKVAARDGVFVGEFGRGKFLERKPTHF